MVLDEGKDSKHLIGQNPKILLEMAEELLHNRSESYSNATKSLAFDISRKFCRKRGYKYLGIFSYHHPENLEFQKEGQWWGWWWERERKQVDVIPKQSRAFRTRCKRVKTGPIYSFAKWIRRSHKYPYILYLLCNPSTILNTIGNFQLTGEKKKKQFSAFPQDVWGSETRTGVFWRVAKATSCFRRKMGRGVSCPTTQNSSAENSY